MFCSECGNEISDNAVVCPKCGVAVAGRKLAPAGTEAVSNHLVGAILTTLFCCLPGGIVAIIYASQVNTKLAQGDIAGAKSASKSAKGWIIGSLIVGGAFSVLYFLFMILVEAFAEA